ncbi:unnamed protein product [Paramecium primaurelia]|uniref:Uncharacterized protein n=1 Tax=Paramecium primaurelia TaxID=5886 RepID=A0A8S1KVG8_PARPR|nr:unnamed protein product [Paramecium primaurelia]
MIHHFYNTLQPFKQGYIELNSYNTPSKQLGSFILTIMLGPNRIDFISNGIRFVFFDYSPQHKIPVQLHSLQKLTQGIESLIIKSLNPHDSKKYSIYTILKIRVQIVLQSYCYVNSLSIIDILYQTRLNRSFHQLFLHMMKMIFYLIRYHLHKYKDLLQHPKNQKSIYQQKIPIIYLDEYSLSLQLQFFNHTVPQINFQDSNHTQLMLNQIQNQKNLNICNPLNCLLHKFGTQQT